jgi:hypothetical protein
LLNNMNRPNYSSYGFFSCYLNPDFMHTRFNSRQANTLSKLTTTLLQIVMLSMDDLRSSPGGSRFSLVVFPPEGQGEFNQEALRREYHEKAPGLAFQLVALCETLATVKSGLVWPRLNAPFCFRNDMQKALIQRFKDIFTSGEPCPPDLGLMYLHLRSIFLWP